MMAEKSGLPNVYDELYGNISMLAHGTATEVLADRDQRSLILANLHSVPALLKSIHLIVANRIWERRVTGIAELEAILANEASRRALSIRAPFQQERFDLQKV